MKSRFLSVVAVLLLLGSCGASRPVERVQPETVVQDLKEGNTEFAFDLFEKLCLESGEDNVMFSPFCISSALGMAWAGARGETESQMAMALGFGDSQSAVHNGFARLFSLIQREQAEPADDPIILNIANALWVQRTFPLLDDYTDLVRESYRAEARNMDFTGAPDAERQTINDWVEDRTAGRITDLLGPGTVNEATRVVLTSAVYFKGNWECEFNRDLTRNGVFTTMAGERIDVPFMHQTGDFQYFRGNGFSVLSLPYSDGNSRMLVFLPEGDVRRFQQEFDRQDLEQALQGLGTREVLLAMPPFEFTASYSLTGPLSELGITDAFSSERADFSGFTGGRDLFISEVVHKAFVKVDETGTEAAAATGLIMATTAMPSDPPLPFILDRPFVFLIMDDISGTVLFMGRVANPAN